MSTIQTTQRVTFTAVATILIPVGVGMFPANLWGGIVVIALGIGSLVLREIFKSV